MYLTDAELLKRIDDLKIEPEDPQAPFDPDMQVGPASIDLRLSNVFWKAQRGLRFRGARVLDLAQVATRELNPTRGWRRISLRSSEKLMLRPGEVALGRTNENFHIPSDCAGALEGRSSYSRMGLSVHASGGFINPGWTGRMPLTLHNQGPFVLKIPVGTPVCQLMLVKLATAPDRDYAHRDDRKYQDDYGGPSVWWRDEMVKRILATPRTGGMTENVFSELDSMLDGSDVSDDALERLEEFIQRQRVGQLSNSDDLIHNFAKSEDRRFWLGRAVKWGSPIALALTITGAANAARNGVGTPDVILWAGSLVSGAATFWTQVRAKLSYLTTDELRRVRGH